MADKKECFIIMPITVSDSMRSSYRDGEEHFIHVMDCLFIPAIEKAGFKPIPPKAQGSDLIHAEIIKNLESSDIVLCDMSCLNPNVFFEFGIRTSLNKPVCVVKDELTEKVPFDTGILNHQAYDSSIDPWKLPAEIEKLTAHIISSVERSKGKNTMWKFLGFKSEAVPFAIEPGTDPRLDYLTMQMDSLHRRMDEIAESSKYDRSPISGETFTTIALERLQDLFMQRSPRNVRLQSLRYIKPDTVEIRYFGNWPKKERDQFRNYLIRKWSINTILREMQEGDME
jgi:hypothetical protein